MCRRGLGERADGSLVDVLCVDDGEIELGKPEKGYRTRFLCDGIVLVSDFVPPADLGRDELLMARMAHDDEVLEDAGIVLGPDLEVVDCPTAHAAVEKADATFRSA